MLTYLPFLWKSQSYRGMWKWWFGCFSIFISSCSSVTIHPSPKLADDVTNKVSSQGVTPLPDPLAEVKRINSSKKDFFSETDSKTQQQVPLIIEKPAHLIEQPNPSDQIQVSNSAPGKIPLGINQQENVELKTELERTPYPESPAQALRKTSPPAQLFDDLWKDDLENGKSFEEVKQPLVEALQKNIQFLEQSPKYQTFLFGNRVLSKEEYINKGLRRFLEIVQNAADPETVFAEVKDTFDFYESYGYYDKKKQKDWGWGHVKITGYYEPILQASKKPNSHFYQALYRRPPDLQHTPVIWYAKDKQDCANQLDRGRLVTKPSKKKKHICQVEFSRLIKQKRQKKWNWIPAPYYTRHQIDNRGALKKYHLELCYVDRLDAYLLQIEGSGRVQFPDGTSLRVRADGQNGLPHQGYSSQILKLASQAKMSVENYLRSMPRSKLSRFLSQNLSYVFFEENNNGVNTSMGVEMTPGRTVAMDSSFFPRGSLIFITGKKPIFSTKQEQSLDSWQTLNRWALIQDTGGAIRGPGRLDLFLGEGILAKKQADLINQSGSVFFLIPKDTESTHLAQKETVPSQRTKPITFSLNSLAQTM